MAIKDTPARTRLNLCASANFFLNVDPGTDTDRGMSEVDKGMSEGEVREGKMSEGQRSSAFPFHGFYILLG